METITNYIIKGLLAINLVAAATSLFGQPFGPEKVLMDRIDRSIVNVESNINKGEWTQAVSNMKQIRNLCNGRPVCSEKIEFTDGYLHQEWYAADGDTTHLNQALGFYGKVVKGNSHYVGARYNSYLIYRQLGQYSKATSQLDDAKSAGMMGTELIKGDLSFEAGEYRNALRNYRQTIDFDPLDKSAHRRLVTLYNYKVGSNKWILTHCGRMRNLGFSDLAINCLSDFINRNYRSTTQGDTVRIALLFWADLSATRNEIDPSQLPAEWNDQAWTELQAVLKNPKAANDVSWWRRREVVSAPGSEFTPNVVLGKVLRSLAQDAIDQNDLKAAAFNLETAFKAIIGGDIYSFLDNPKNIPQVFYDVTGELGILYTLHPDLPDAKRKFEELEDELFNGKAVAYIESRGEAIEKFHTTLGLIYAARKKWQGGGKFRNAMFQLSNAIEKAPEWRNNGNLKLQLSKGYLATDRLLQAKATLIDEAKAFLNYDDLRMADSAIYKYNALGGEHNASYQEIKSIYDFRLAVAGMTTNQLRSFKEVTATINSMTGGTESKSFFHRTQRFKMLSDVASQSTAKKEERASLYYYGAAFLEAYELNNLVNLTDVSRVSKQVKAIKSHVNFTGTSGDLLTYRPEQQKEEVIKWWDWSDADRVRQSIGVNSKALMSAALTTKLNAASMGFSNQRKVWVDSDGKVYSKDKLYFERLLSGSGTKVGNMSELNSNVAMGPVFIKGK